MNNILGKYITHFKNPKILIIVGAVGILLIYLSSFFGSTDTKEKAEANQSTLSAEQYRKQLEEDICDMVSQITGSKKVTAVITLESGIKYSYADIKEETEAGKTEQDEESFDKELKAGYITVKTADGGEQALLITENMPEIRGVAIVCEGGDNEIINEKIKSTVTAAFNITSKRVYICGRMQ